jgi:putative tryptophan/tyrosine transport system substrate-binding protein
MLDLRRRQFITLLVGAAAAWPLVAQAQQGERVRRIGVLMLYPENDPEGQLRATALRNGLQKRLVMSLARPGGNLTGLYVFEPSIGAKLLELLKEIAPHVARAAILFNPDAKAASWLAAAATVAPRFAVEVIEAPVRDSNEIEAAIAQWGRQPNYGLIVLPDPATNAHRKLINMAARYRLPAIHALSGATRDGGLMSYGVDLPDVFRQAAAYADRILKGDKPADLPVQLPTRFELAINLKTAKALGLTVPNSLMVSADEVIE